MASENYIKRPRPKDYCRLCLKSYETSNNNSKECRFNIFNKKENKLSIQERLSAVNVLVEKNPNDSDTVCRKCEIKIKKVEEAKVIQESWRGVKRKTETENEPVSKLPRTDEVIKKVVFLLQCQN